MGDYNTSQGIACYRRKIRMLFNEPPPRLEIVSPYSVEGGGYTKAQLDMRRKAEILQYKTSTKSGSNNRLTRAERFAKVATGGRVTNSRVQSTNGNCAAKPTLSNRSDVPGPPVTLFLDSNIPLYNYQTNVRDYASLEKIDEDPWKLLLDKSFPTYQSNIAYTLGILEMREESRESTRTFEFAIPYTLQNINDSLQSATFEVLFNGLPVIQLDPFVYDISIPGMLIVRNIQLYSSPEYAYILSLKVTTTIGDPVDILFDEINIEYDGIV